METDDLLRGDRGHTGPKKDGRNRELHRVFKRYDETLVFANECNGMWRVVDRKAHHHHHLPKATKDFRRSSDGWMVADASCQDHKDRKF